MCDLKQFPCWVEILLSGQRTCVSSLVQVSGLTKCLSLLV